MTGIQNPGRSIAPGLSLLQLQVYDSLRATPSIQASNQAIEQISAVSMWIQSRILSEQIETRRVVTKSINALGIQLDEIRAEIVAQTRIIHEMSLTLTDISESLQNPLKTQAAELRRNAERSYQRSEYAIALNDVTASRALFRFDPQADFLQASCHLKLNQEVEARESLLACLGNLREVFSDTDDSLDVANFKIFVNVLLLLHSLEIEPSNLVTDSAIMLLQSHIAMYKSGCQIILTAKGEVIRHFGVSYLGDRQDLREREICRQHLHRLLIARGHMEFVKPFLLDLLWSASVPQNLRSEKAGSDDLADALFLLVDHNLSGAALDELSDEMYRLLTQELDDSVVIRGAAIRLLLESHNAIVDPSDLQPRSSVETGVLRWINLLDHLTPYAEFFSSNRSRLSDLLTDSLNRLEKLKVRKLRFFVKEEPTDLSQEVAKVLGSLPGTDRSWKLVEF